MAFTFQQSEGLTVYVNEEQVQNKTVATQKDSYPVDILFMSLAKRIFKMPQKRVY